MKLLLLGDQESSYFGYSIPRIWKRGNTTIINAYGKFELDI